MDINKYFIAIIPPDPVATEIFQMKEYMREKYNSRASLNSPAHITLHMPFEWRAAKEEQLVAGFNKFSIDPFQIELQNYGCFEPRAIFVDVKKNAALDECQRKMMQFCKTEFNLFNALYHDRPFNPHITIAFRDMKTNVFEKAWGEFKERRYSASFLCGKVSLLKHDGKFWREFS